MGEEKKKDAFIYGADLSWVSQLQALGFSWVDENQELIDPILACKKMGVNAVRLRVFVNPPADAYWQKRPNELVMLGYCDVKGVCAAAEKAQDLGLDVMVDFHYSDHFADPLFQDIPAAWRNDTDQELIRHVYQHTKEVMRTFRAAGIEIKWAQVGNEINPGLLLPRGSLRKNPALLVRLLNAGFEAVKEEMPECLVVTHLAELQSQEHCFPFLDQFVQRQGKSDIFAFSYYPYWYHCSAEKVDMMRWLRMYEERYHRPVMVSEMGEEEKNEEGSYLLLRRMVEAAKETGALGVMYWEPEVNRKMMPDFYPLGACHLLGEKTLQFTKALTAFRDCAIG